MAAIETMNVAQHAGVGLRIERERKRRSLRQVAERSGIGRSTLSRWETGESRPDSRDIERVLVSLGLGRTEILAFIEKWDVEARPEPAAGARQRLFRAMRMREGLTLTESASKIGVSKASLSRWESGDRWPGSERLALAAQSIGATPREVQAIRSNGPLMSLDDESAASIRYRISALRSQIAAGECRTMDMEFIALDTMLTGKPDGELRELRVELRATYIEWLGWWYRDVEAGALAERLLPKIAERRSMDVWGRVLRSAANHATEFRRDPVAALEMLESGVEILKGCPSEAFVRRELVGRLIEFGEFKLAAEHLERARDLDTGDESWPVHDYCCSMVESALWIAQHRPDRAAKALPRFEVMDPYLRTCSAVGKADVLQKVGDSGAARNLMQDTLCEMVGRGLDHFATGLKRRVAVLDQQPTAGIA